MKAFRRVINRIGKSITWFVRLLHTLGVRLFRVWLRQSTVKGFSMKYNSLKKF